MTNVEENLLKILEEIRRALANSPAKSRQVKILGAAKKQSSEKISSFLELAQKLNIQVIVGENYVQEFESHRDVLIDFKDVESHLIGHLQTNKAKKAVQLFDVIESVDSERLVRALQKEACKEGKIQRIFLQINISSDPAKGGLAVAVARSEVPKWLSESPNLRFCGLMTITEDYEDPELVRRDYRAMRELYSEILNSSDFLPFISQEEFELSMGMSADFHIAVEEGATIVRIGSALFGSR